jgi:hypothetical protein
MILDFIIPMVNKRGRAPWVPHLPELKPLSNARIASSNLS